MSINPYNSKNYSNYLLNSNLDNSKINILRKLVIGGFREYSSFVRKYNSNLFLDTRFEDEICDYLDKLMINVIKNQIPTYGSRELREHKIVKALNNDDYFTLASIIASAARSAVAFTPIIKHAIANYYKMNEHEYYEIEFEEIKELDISQTDSSKFLFTF